MNKLCFIIVLVLISSCFKQPPNIVTQKTVTQESKTTPQMPEINLEVKPKSAKIVSAKEIDFSIRVTNTGKVNLKTAKLVNLLPPGVKYIDSRPPGIYTPAQKKQPATLIWQVDHLAPRQFLNFHMVFLPQKGGYKKNTAQLVYADKVLEASGTIIIG